MQRNLRRYRVRGEEAALLSGLGEDYREYMNRTKCFVPFDLNLKALSQDGVALYQGTPFRRAVPARRDQFGMAESHGLIQNPGRIL